MADLHDLGIALWYKDMEDYDSLILNPEWISHGVYKIINWVNEQKRHSLSLFDFKQVFSADAERYPKEEHQFLFELMKKYKLAYETHRGKKLIIPHLMKEDRPSKLPEFTGRESLMLLYKADRPLPPNTVSRFIVEHNEEIADGLVWRYGVVLKKGNSLAMVREDPQIRSISVEVKGEFRSDYISELRSTLNLIFDGFKIEKPELQYRIERDDLQSIDVERKRELMLSDRKVKNLYRDDVPYYDDETGRYIPMAHTVNIYHIQAERVVVSGESSSFVHDQSVHNTFNFQDCNIGLQGNLNDLAQLLDGSGNQDEARTLKETADLLEDAEECKSPNEVRKKGLASRLQRVVDELEDESSTLNKAVKGVKNGVSIASEIGKAYLAIKGWMS